MPHIPSALTSLVSALRPHQRRAALPPAPPAANSRLASDTPEPPNFHPLSVAAVPHPHIVAKLQPPVSRHPLRHPLQAQSAADSETPKPQSDSETSLSILDVPAEILASKICPELSLRDVVALRSCSGALRSTLLGTQAGAWWAHHIIPHMTQRLVDGFQSGRLLPIFCEATRSQLEEAGVDIFSRLGQEKNYQAISDGNSKAVLRGARTGNQQFQQILANAAEVENFAQVKRRDQKRLAHQVGITLSGGSHPNFVSIQVMAEQVSANFERALSSSRHIDFAVPRAEWLMSRMGQVGSSEPGRPDCLSRQGMTELFSEFRFKYQKFFTAALRSQSLVNLISLKLDIFSYELIITQMEPYFISGHAVFNGEAGIFDNLQGLKQLDISRPNFDFEDLTNVPENGGQWNPPVSLLNNCALLDRLVISVQTDAMAVVTCLLHDNSVPADQARSSAAAENISYLKVDPAFLRSLLFDDAGFGYKDPSGAWVVRNRQEKKDLLVAAFRGLKRATEIDLSSKDVVVLQSDDPGPAVAGRRSKPPLSVQDLVQIVMQAPAMRHLKLPPVTPSHAEQHYDKLTMNQPNSVVDKFAKIVEDMGVDLAKDIAAQLSIHPTLMNLSIGQMQFKRSANCDDFVRIEPEPEKPAKTQAGCHAN
jgi:hypothetical protein